MATSTAPLDFTDGDTLKRFTITDANVSTTAQPMLQSVRRQTIADVDDPGWIYTANVVGIRNGSFDVLVNALMGDAPAGPGEFPNETASLVYTIQ